MEHELRYLVRAQSDLEAISTYLNSRNPAVANTVVHAIDERILGPTHSPWMGPPADEPDTRQLTIVGHPCKVYYRV